MQITKATNWDKLKEFGTSSHHILATRTDCTLWAWGCNNYGQVAWIHDQWDFSQTHPVLHFSFDAMGVRDIGLEEAIEKQLDEKAAAYEIHLMDKGIALRFSELIMALTKKHGKVVLLN